MMHVVVRLRPDKAPLSHDNSGAGEVLHPVAPLKLTPHTHLSLHSDICATGRFIYLWVIARFLLE